MYFAKTRSLAMMAAAAALATERMKPVVALVLHALWEQGASADYAAIIIEQHRRKDAA